MRKRMTKKITLIAAAAMLTIACAFTAMAATRLDTPDDLYWSSTSKEDDSDYDEGSYAKWDEVEHANRYRITLYCEDESGSTRTMKSDITTSKTYCNLRRYMTVEGDYYFRVRAESTRSGYSDSRWSSYSDYYYVSASAAENAANGVYDDNKATAMIVNSDPGWTADEIGIKYIRSDGTYPVNGWFQDPTDQNWFYIDENGYIKTGFIEDETGIYYCDPEGIPYGAMVTGSILYDGVIYNFNESGALISTEDGLGEEE